MVGNPKPTGRAQSIPAGLAIAEAIGIVITLLLGAMEATLVAQKQIQETQIGYGIMLILLIGAAVTSTVAWKKIKHRKLLVCTLSGAIYLLLLLFTTALFFGGQYEGLLPGILLVACGTMLPVLLSRSTGGAGKRRKRKRTNR